MSIDKHQCSPLYHYHFEIGGRRFHGSTGCMSRREAEAVERAEREKARALSKRGPANVPT